MPGLNYVVGETSELLGHVAPYYKTTRKMSTKLTVGFMRNKPEGAWQSGALVKGVAREKSLSKEAGIAPGLFVV